MNGQMDGKSKHIEVGAPPKKGDKQLLQNYRPVFMLPILEEILEKILFNSMFEYLQKNNLLFENKSGFWPYDS